MKIATNINVGIILVNHKWAMGIGVWQKSKTLFYEK